MGKYYLHKDGVLDGTGAGADGHEGRQAFGGYQVGLGDPPSWLVAPATVVPYQVNRRDEYPSMGDQMDMLWHAMKDGTLPKVEPFFSQIAAVKSRYPKPSN